MTTPDEDITGYGGPGKTGSMQPTGGSPGESGAPAGMGEETRAKARQAADEIRQQGRAQFEDYRGSAADELEKVAQGAEAELENQDRAGLSRYVSDMAQSMVELADNLRGKSVDELVGEVDRLARNNPALFIAGSVALGFGLTRFARASSHRTATATREPTHDYGHSDVARAHPTSPLGVPADATAQSLPSQAELDSRISSGAPAGSVGSISNAGVPTSGAGGNGKGTDGGLNR